MGDVPRAEREVAGSRRDHGVADLEGDLSFQDPETLVLVVVDVQRSLRAGGLGHLHDGHQAACVGGALP